MFIKLLKELDIFLKPHQISTFTTDVFEETLLRIASVSTQPKGCSFGEDEDRIYIKIRAITESDADKLLAVLKILGKDQNAKYKYTYGTIGDEEEFMPLYWFKVNTACVYQNLLPLFKTEFIKLIQGNPSAYQIYQEKTLNHPKWGVERDWNESQTAIVGESIDPTINSFLNKTKLGLFKPASTNGSAKKFSSDLVFNRYSKSLGFYCEINCAEVDFTPMRRYVNVGSKDDRDEPRSYLLVKEDQWQLFYVDDRVELKDVDLNAVAGLKNLLKGLSTEKNPADDEIKALEDLLNKHNPEELIIAPPTYTQGFIN